MGRYASLHVLAASTRFFTRKFGHQVSETTLHSVKKVYLHDVTRKRANEEDDETVDILPHHKRGRPILLGESVDGKVQMYLRRSLRWGWSGNGTDCGSCCSRYSPVV